MSDLVENVKNKFRQLNSAQADYKEAQQRQLLERDIGVLLKHISKEDENPLVVLQAGTISICLSLEASRVLRDWLVRVLGPAGYD